MVGRGSRLAGVFVLALALAAVAAPAASAGRPESGGRDIQRFATAWFETEAGECRYAFVSVVFIAGDNLQGPIGSGAPGSWSDVTVTLDVHDTCADEHLGTYSNWVPVPDPDLELFERASVVAEVPIPDGPDGPMIATIDLDWLASSAQEVRIDHHLSAGSFRQERYVWADIEGSVSITGAGLDPDPLVVTEDDSFGAQLGWAAEIAQPRG